MSRPFETPAASRGFRVFEQHVWALPVFGLSALLVFHQHRRGSSGTRPNKSADNPVRPAGPTSFMIRSAIR